MREAISNIFDAHATEITLGFETEQVSGKTNFVIRLIDNGDGMGQAELQSFFKVYFRDVEIGGFDAEALRFRPVQVMR